MTDMKDITERLKEYLESKTEEELESEFESITHIKFWNRWCEKFHSLGKEKRYEIIEKVIKKYGSDTYRKREYRLGYEPREELFQLFAYYAETYGVVLEDKGYYTNFVGDAMIFDDTWVIQILYGQGTVIHVNHKDKFNNKV